MSGHGSDRVFEGSVPEFYERFMVPMLFEPYAQDLVTRLGRFDPGSVLEVAAGTGVVTRAMAVGLPEATAITATDLSQSMVDHGEAVGTSRPVRWQAADVTSLPFEDESFDAVVCQFGAMFFPDKAAAFREVCRVLRPGGVFLFNVWDRIETNEFADVVTSALAEVFPLDPPRFLARTPYGYFDEATIRADVAAGGFATPVGFEGLEARSRVAVAEVAALAFCQGTPLRNEIEARDSGRLDEATAAAAAALRDRFGSADLDGRMFGYVITATKT